MFFVNNEAHCVSSQCSRGCLLKLQPHHLWELLVHWRVQAGGKERTGEEFPENQFNVLPVSWEHISCLEYQFPSLDEHWNHLFLFFFLSTDA